MNLSVGIVGLPNVGKSTLFNALLKRQAAFVANYPFATIEPNVGVVPVPDPRLDELAKVIRQSEGSTKSMSDPGWPPRVPSTVKFVDIAGLVAGASEGEGLGNKFLSHIREVDMICHVVRFFQDSDVVHVGGTVEPKRDIEIINSELVLADLETLKKSKDAKMQSFKEPKEKLKKEAIEKLYQELNKGILAKDVGLRDEEEGAIRDLHLLTMKPVIYVANVSEEQLASKNAFHPRGVMASAPLQPATPGVDTPDQVGDDLMVISAKIESELSSLSESDQKAYLTELGMEESGLDRLIKLSYKTLGLISFLTAGEKEVRAWTIKKGTLAPGAAGVIHTDFEKGFIKADVITFQEFVSLGGWQKAREVGKIRLEGREYVVQDGDVVEFKVNA